MEVKFLDTTFRDGSQSLWAMGIRHGMMEPIAADMDRAGFEVIEAPANPIHFKKMVRDLKEDPWDLMKVLAKAMPNTPKSCMGSGFNLNPFGTPTPPSIGKLFWSRLFEIGVLQRLQMTGNTMDQLTRDFPTVIPVFKDIGFKIAIALSYSISPRHTDEHYAEKARQAAALEPDAIYLKDQGGLLTVDRIRTLIPIIIENAKGIPVELHSHCTTGLAPSVYMEALNLGVETLHTGIPPLAEGSAQPSVFNVARNARNLGHTVKLDIPLLESISKRLTSFAKQDNMPVGGTTAFDNAQFIHQIPGGVISNLRFQLAELGLENRLDEVIEESVQIRKDLGYPIMITPYSQYMCTQAALNVASGERYKVVADEIIRFAQGIYGEDSGQPWMDQNVKDKLLNLPHAKDLAKKGYKPAEDLTPDQVRKRIGAPNISDEDLVLRTIMQGTQEIDAMHAAGPPKQYTGTDMPLRTLIDELGKHKNIRYVQVKRGTDSVVLQNRASA